MLISAFNERPDKVAMRIVGSDDEIYTFGELLHKIRSVAYRLGQEKVEFGDRVALIGENHPSWAIAYLGALYHGAVIVPMDPHGEIETIITSRRTFSNGGDTRAVKMHSRSR